MPQIRRRLSPFGRQLLVQRVLSGRPVAHVAAEMGVSRQTAHRWISRFKAEGEQGLLDRSSAPRRRPSRTPRAVEERVLRERSHLRRGPLRIAAATGVPARTVSRILARHGTPPLRDLDPVTGAVIRASRTTAVRYERERPGELVHVDVKKLGRIPVGGGWRAHGRCEKVRGRRIGFDYVHVAVDDRSRLAFAEILPDETGASCAAFLRRAAQFFTRHGVRVERVLTDNALAYRRSRDFRDTATELGIQQRFIKPHCPWTNGKAERFNRTLQIEWAYRQPFVSSQERNDALAPWLDYYNTERIHLGIGAIPISRVSTT